MSFFEDASLVYIPSAVKSGKTYAVKPTDGTGDLTFTRASDATRVASNGLIEKVRTNLLLQSNQFDTTWGTYDTSVTGGQSGYDGSSDAWLLAITGATGFQTIRQTISNSGAQTLSMYAKAGTLDWVRITFAGGSGPTNYYNISNGTLGSVGGGIADIEDVGNGWYRISAFFSGSFTELRIYPATDNNNPNQSSGNIYIQDAQLEQGLVATEYIETTTAAVSVGPVSGLPRLDYLNSSCPRLLLEPQRTNLITQSEYLSGLTIDNATLTDNATTSPEGVQNATLVAGDGTLNVHRFYELINFTSGTTYTFSIFAKAGTNDFFQIYLGNPFDASGGQVYANFDLSDGSKGTAGTNVIDHDIEDYGNGWYRCYMTAQSQLTGSTGVFYNLTASASVGRAASNTLSTNVEFYGAQVEAGSYPTSYIPTYGTSVTRVLEICGGVNSASLFNDSEGVLFVEFSALSDTRDNQFRFMISDGTNNERIQIGLPTDDELYASVIAGNTATASFTYTLPNPSQTHKIALKYKSNDCSLWVDGVKIASETSAAMPTGLDIFDFYRTPNNNNYVEANVKQVLYFPTALSDSDLATLTSL